MSAFIKKYRARNGAVVVQVVFKQGRQVTRMQHIGTAHDEEQLALLLASARKVIEAGQLRLDLFAASGDATDLRLESTHSRLLWETLGALYDRLGFGALGDEVFRQLVLARIIEPASKLDTIRILRDLGIDAPSNSGVHRTLARVAREDYRERLAEACLAAAAPSAPALVLYDVTTLYFETQKEDAYRRPGLSKERRLEPQIILGLLVDETGFPLEVQSFPGNRAEVKTIAPVLRAFSRRHGACGLTVVADAAMLSGENLTYLEELGWDYIVASRLAKTPYAVAEHLAAPGAELTDGQIFDAQLPTVIAGRRCSRRVIYQYRERRARLDLLNIDKALAKAQRMAKGEIPAARNRFLRLTGAACEVNEELACEARRKAGIKGYVTSCDLPAQEVIDAYHRLFRVERSFRMSKSDLRARPIFHHQRDAIEAHLTVVFAALAVTCAAEATAGITIRRIIEALRPLRCGVLRVGGRRITVEPQISEKTQALLTALGSGGGGS